MGERLQTLLLNLDGWDLCIDAIGNIAVASEPYSQVQDVASAARLFIGELYYGPAAKGIPYFQESLGRPVPTQLLKSRIVAAAVEVPGVNSASCFLTNVSNRTISGQIQIQTDAGTQVVAL